MRSTIFLTLLSAFIAQTAIPAAAFPLDLATREPFGFHGGMGGRHGGMGGPHGGMGGFRGGPPGGGAPGGDAPQRRELVAREPYGGYGGRGGGPGGFGGSRGASGHHAPQRRELAAREPFGRGGFGGHRGPPGGFGGFRGGPPGGGAAGGDAPQRRELTAREPFGRGGSHMGGSRGGSRGGPRGGNAGQRRSYSEDAMLEVRHNGKQTVSWIHRIGGLLTTAVAPAVGDVVGNYLRRRSWTVDEEAFARREVDEQELARRSFLKTAFSVGKKLVGAFLKREMVDYPEMAALDARDLTAEEHAFLNHVAARGLDSYEEELARRSMSDEELERRSFWKSALKVGGKIIGSLIKREDLTLEERELAEHFSDLAARGLDGEEDELARRSFLKTVGKIAGGLFKTFL